MSARSALHRMLDTVSLGENGADREPSAAGASPEKMEEVRLRLSSIMQEVANVAVDEAGKVRDDRHDPSLALRWFVPLDALVFVVAFYAAWIGVVVFHTVFLNEPMPSLGEASMAYYGLTALGAMLWFAYKGQYSRRMPFWMEVQKIVKVMGFSMLVHGFVQFAAKVDFSRLWLMAGWVFAAFGLILAHAVARVLMHRTGVWQVRTLLVGSGLMAEEARSALRTEPGLGYEIVANVEDLGSTLERFNGSWTRLCDRYHADYVIVALEGPELAAADEAIASLVESGLPFSVTPPLRHLPVLGMAAQYFFSHDVIFMSPVDNLEQPIPRFVKRAMDVLVSGVALVLLSPLFLILAVLIRRDGGPAFFGDKRIGVRGKIFYCLKFRSMIINSDAVLTRYLEENPEKVQEWETYRKLRDGDPRVTKVGAFMRQWSIDELPQLINVLRGDMSLVGPRPIMFTEKDIYKNGMALYSRVRPGLTGLWQVSGRNNVTFARRVQMESWYVRNWSLWHDIAILCKTVPVLLKKTGAY